MPKKRSNLQSKSELLAVRSFLGAVGALPLETSMKFGKSLGKFIGARFPKLSKTARRNLEIAFPGMPESEREKIIRGTFESLGRHLGFVSHFKKFKHEDIRYLVELEGRENFDRAVETANIINRAKSENRRIIAVGTTTTRALESSANENGKVEAGNFTANLTVTPGYQFKIIDGLLTNFHLPQSSLLVLVATFAGYDLTMNAYRHAVASRYRFYSYGDCMLIHGIEK